MIIFFAGFYIDGPPNTKQAGCLIAAFVSHPPLRGHRSSRQRRRTTRQDGAALTRGCGTKHPAFSLFPGAGKCRRKYIFKNRPTFSSPSLSVQFKREEENLKGCPCEAESLKLESGEAAKHAGVRFVGCRGS